MKRLAVCAVLLTVAAQAMAAGKRIVLPDAVTPESYRIEFTPDSAGLTFKGSVQIDVLVHAATSNIVLNAADLKIDSAMLARETRAAAVSYDDKLQTATFTFDHALAPGPHTLNLVYHGTIYQSASGLFALDYQDSMADSKAGPKARLRALFTQFENSDARRFVPCWDEPGRKATFDLTATLPANLLPLSNMPVASTEALPGGLQRVHFATTPKMSTYLLFFGAGDFERVHRMVNGVDVGVVVKRGDTASASFALDAAATLLPYYNDYFGTAYPLPKLDLIAAPGASQFFGAMENWGAIFYFEKFLLVDARLSTQEDRQGVYSVVAHEMAHQWFGDLVTMQWWDDLWLNEGFASWMANKVTDHFHPEWKVWLQSLVGKQAVMQRDAREGTHPIITPIEDVFQAGGAFDDITYTKGEAVIRTLESHIGEDAFRAGVRRYMHAYAFRNTVTDDLWTQIARESTVPIAQIAHDLTLQAGVPMVNMLASSCVGGNTTLTLNQSHFVIDAGSTKARLWRLPVRVAILDGAATSTIVSGPAPQQVKAAGCGTAILNAGQGAYLRSRYSHDGLVAIASHYARLAPDDQLGVLNDSMSLANAGQLPMSDYLALTKNFPADADPVVASSVVLQFEELDRIYAGLPTQAAFRNYARQVLQPIFARVGWDRIDGESDNTAILRADLLGALVDFGDTQAIAQTQTRFARYLANPSSFDANARSSLLRNVAARADQQSWDRLHAMAKSAPTELERKEFYELLASSESEELTRQALALVFSDEPPATLAPQIVSFASFLHPQLALDFAIDHWDKLSAMLESSSTAQFVPRLTRNSADLKLLEKLDAFAAAHIPPSARQDFRRAAARIRYLAKVRAERLPEADRWIAAQKQ